MSKEDSEDLADIEGELERAEELLEPLKQELSENIELLHIANAWANQGEDHRGQDQYIGGIRLLMCYRKAEAQYEMLSNLHDNDISSEESIETVFEYEKASDRILRYQCF